MNSIEESVSLSGLPAVIETEQLSRSYRTYRKPEGLWSSVKGLWNRQYIETQALTATTLRITPGQIVGLVGANGAGKTTLLKLLSGLIVPTSGTARVLGEVPWQRSYGYLRRISILLGQKNQLWWDISPLDSFALLAKIYDLNASAARDRVQFLAEKLRCVHVLEMQLRRLSLGERMKMEIIGALLHEPEVLFLDEPTIGLDIVAQETIREFLEEYVADRGPTVLLTSHYMDDIARLAQKLLLISRGSIVYEGTVGKFIGEAGDVQQVYLRFGTELPHAVTLPGGHQLGAGAKEHHLKLRTRELGPVVAAAAGYGEIVDVKMEETDFESVIRSFLTKESGVL